MISKEERAEISRLGGLAAHRSGRVYEWSSEAAKAAGRKGGLKSAGRGSEYMAEIGRKGGLKVASIPGHMSEMGRKGGLSAQAKKRTIGV